MKFQLRKVFTQSKEKQRDEKLSDFIEINFFPPHVKSLISSLSQSHREPNNYEENLRKQQIWKKKATNLSFKRNISSFHPAAVVQIARSCFRHSLNICDLLPLACLLHPEKYVFYFPEFY